ncbi:MAG: nucleotidyltransferase domain-containing protein [Thermoproteus sp.]
MEIYRWREDLRRRALELAEAVASAVDGTVLLIGSYARGDFAEDSDVDVLVVGRFSEPPHRRLLGLKTPPGVEAVPLTVEEALRAAERCYPIAHDIALGIVLKDGLGIAQRLVELSRRCAEGR